MVLDGVADMAWVNPGLTPDRFPDNDVLEFPGLFRDLKEATLVSTRVVASGALRGYDDFFVIAATANFPLMVHTRPPIGSPADFRGKILRVNNLIEGDAIICRGSLRGSGAGGAWRYERPAYFAASGPMICSS